MSCKQTRLLLTVVLFTLGMSCARASTVLAGFATEDITPPLNLDMAGFGPFLERKATGIHVNYSVRNVILSEQMHEYPADLTGVALAKIVQENPGSVGIYLQGSCGDINPRPTHQINNQPPENCLSLLSQLSEAFAAYVRQALASASPLDVQQMEMESKRITPSSPWTDVIWKAALWVLPIRTEWREVVLCAEPSPIRRTRCASMI